MAAPPHVIDQAKAKDGARAVFGERTAAFDRMAGVYDNAGIATRRSCVPIEWYFRPHGWADRNATFLSGAVDLLTDAAERCLANAGIGPADVDAIVTVCSTGIATPSLDALVMERLPFRRTVTRLPIFGLGCAGGVLGLGRASALVRAMPGSRVLLLVVELCGLTFRLDDLSQSNIVATALFGDGAAAVLLDDADAPGARVGACGEHTWPDSLDVMGWEVEGDGLGVRFARDIPTRVRTGLRSVTDTFLASHDLALGDLDGLICHPGGSKVVEALESAFDLEPGTLVMERSVLRDFGNMSSSTVLFVLARKLAEGARGRHLMSALGPGFTAGFALLDI